MRGRTALVDSSAGLVPWTALLALALPAGLRADEGSAASLGFAVLLIASIAATAVQGRRRRDVVAFPLW